MTQPVVTVAEAARKLRRTPQTVNGWIRKGAPCVRPGRPARNQGALVIVEDLKTWLSERSGHRQGFGALLWENVAAGLVDVLRRDGGGDEGLPLHRCLGVSERHASALMVEAYQRIYRRCTTKDPATLPGDLESVFSSLLS
jgi:hypothetical protein